MAATFHCDGIADRLMPRMRMIQLILPVLLLSRGGLAHMDIRPWFHTLRRENGGVTLAAQEPKPLAKVLYSIQSGQNTFPRLAACLSTWASALPKDQLQVIGLAAPNESVVDLANWHATTCPDTHDAGACKDSHALVTAFNAKADWVVLVGDDNYVVTDNFAEMLGGYNASEPMVLGIMGCGVCKAGGLCGGGGQVFSRGALEQFMQNGKVSFLKEAKVEADACGMWGDVANCRVASKHGVPVRSLPGLHGWEEKGKVLETSVHSREPKPLTFHYVTAEGMKALHEQVLGRLGAVASAVLVGKNHAQTVALAGSGVRPEYAQAWNAYVSRENQKRREELAT